MKRYAIVLSVMVMFVAAGSAGAHHGFMGIFDLTNPPSKFEGVITNVEWQNPHISFNVDVKDETGKVTNWRFEGANPAALLMRGWVRTDLRVGDKVTVQGYRATKGLPVAAAGALTLATGRTLDAASDGVPPYRAKPAK